MECEITLFKDTLFQVPGIMADAVDLFEVPANKTF